MKCMRGLAVLTRRGCGLLQADKKLRIATSICVSQRKRDYRINPPRTLAAIPSPHTVAKTPSSAPRIDHVTETAEEDMLLRWDDGSHDEYPYVYLRDSCDCELCFERKSMSRLQGCMDTNIRPQSVQIADDNASVCVVWPDGHESVFTNEWLKSSSFREHAQSEAEDQMLLEPPRDQLWGNEMEDKIKTWDYQAVMSEDNELDSFLWELSTTGIAVINNSPTKKGMLNNLCERVSFLSPTHYGHTFEVYTRENPGNFAYLSGPLPLHNDMVYNDPNPGIQFFHFIKQCEQGGANTLVDGFNAARQLEAENPEAFRMLTTTRVINPDRGHDEFVGDFFHCSHKPPIELCNFTGRIKSIQVNLAARNFRLVEGRKLKAMYDAYAAFKEKLNCPSNVITVRSQTGDMLIIDNQRVLHGRTEFVAMPHEQGTTFRHLHGGYVDWKDVMSRIRVLRQKAGVFKATFLN